MASDHTPTAVALPSLVSLVTDGDKRKAASVRPAFEVTLNAIKALKDLVAPGGSGEIVERMAGVPMPGSNATLFAGTDGDGLPTPRVVCTGTFKFCYLLDLPHGAGLRQVRAYLYRDGSSVLSSVLIEVVRRNYAVTVDTGDSAFAPEETIIASSSAAPTAMTGGMSHVSATFSAHTVDRDDAADYFARVSGVVTGAGLGFVSFMPKVRQWVQLIQVDKGAA